MSAFSNLLKLRKLLNPLVKINHVRVRSLFSQGVLNLTSFEEAKHMTLARLGKNREQFFKTMAEMVEKKQNIFTKDFRYLILLTETDEEYQLMLRVRELYKEQQRNSAFPGYFRSPSYILRMLYINNKVSTAYEWFQDERTTIEHDAANVNCFILMMDMLFEAGRYDDVISLMANVDVYMNTPSGPILTLYFAALYKKNTKTALSQAMSKLQDCCEKEYPLPNRCLFYSAMLAYNQGDYQTMLEMDELPAFYLAHTRSFTRAHNLQLLAFIGLGRLEDCMGALNCALTNIEGYRVPCVFPGVMETLSEAVEEKDSVEMKEAYHHLKMSLIKANLIASFTMDSYMTSPIHLNEYMGMKELYLKKSMLAYKGYSVQQDKGLVGQQDKELVGQEYLETFTA